MKRQLKRTIFLSALCLILTVITVPGQKEKSPEDEIKIPEPVEVKVEIKQEPPAESPPAETPPAESPPVYEAPSVTETGTSNSSETGPVTPPVETPSSFPQVEQRRNRRAGQRAEIERRNREARNTKDDKKDKDEVICPYYDEYGNCSYVPISTDVGYSAPSAPVDPLAYFDEDDIVFFAYQSYLDPDPANYMPYFGAAPGPLHRPLLSVFPVGASPDLPFRNTGWVFYYEPDLDNLFIDFSRFGNVRFERLLLIPEGRTVDKVNGRFGRRDGRARPVLVTDISGLPKDQLHSFGLRKVPEGTYELRLVNRNGDTVRIGLEID